MHISEVSVSNFKIIDALKTRFRNGLNVITGETGAGKTILLGAIGFALGERASRDVILRGTDEASVEVIFDLDAAYRGGDKTTDMGLQSEFQELLSGLLTEDDDILVLKRVMRSDGRSRSFVNYRPVPFSVLQRVGDLLVDFHGQHEHQRLFSTRYQLLTLDQFAGLSASRVALGHLRSDFKELSARLLETAARHRRASEDKALLEHYVHELQQSDVTQGEFESLQNERRTLLYADKIAGILASVDEALYSRAGAVCETLGALERQLVAAKDMDASLTDAAEKMADSRLTLDELAREARDRSEQLLSDPNRLEMIEDRVAELSALARKHRCEPEDLPQKLAEFESDLADCENRTEELTLLTKERDELANELCKKAEALSKQRKASASHLSSLVELNLKQLGMQSCQFVIDFIQAFPGISEKGLGTDDDLKLPGRDGFDKVEFSIAPNPGQPLMPLRKIASGGELSRIMIAIKAALATSDDVPVMVFDELDSGIGGATGLQVGKMLRELSGSRQILTITHLVQIARFAEGHLSVEKSDHKASDFAIKVRELEGAERVDEIARMLGSEAGEDAQEFAARLLGDVD
ncbi:DNA repair protein RecN [bacterium]|nr:DNA repair protein RecN [bacterium]